MAAKMWRGSKPEDCDTCGADISNTGFVDGKTTMGPWAMMCFACHERCGVGLGLGRGQKYNAKLEKVEG